MDEREDKQPAEESYADATGAPHFDTPAPAADAPLMEDGLPVESEPIAPEQQSKSIRITPQVRIKRRLDAPGTPPPREARRHDTLKYQDELWSQIDNTSEEEWTDEDEPPTKSVRVLAPKSRQRSPWDEVVERVTAAMAESPVDLAFSWDDYKARWRAKQREARQPKRAPREVLAAWAAFWKCPRSWYLSAIFVLSCVLFVAFCSKYWTSVVDDAYISFRFSRNLIEGHGWVFNIGGPRVEGFTNFTWVLLVAGALAAGFDAMIAAKVMGMACGLGTMWLSWRFLAAMRRRDDAMNLIPAILLATNSHFAYWAVQGLETLLQSLLVLATYHRFFVETKDGRRRMLSPVLAVLAVMTRLDSLVYLLPLGVWAICEAVAATSPLRRLAAWAAIFLILFVPYFGWRWMTFGDFLPNPYYAKLVAEKPNAERGSAHIHEYYFNQAGWERSAGTEPPAFGTLEPSDMAERQETLRLRWLLSGGSHNSAAWTMLWLMSLLWCLAMFRPRVAALVLLPMAVNMWYVRWIGGDWMPGFRFFQVAAPFIAASVGLAIGFWRDFVGDRRRLWMPPAVLFAALLFVNAFEQMGIETAYVFGREPVWQQRLDDWHRPREVMGSFRKEFRPVLSEVAERLLVMTQDDTTIAMSDVGLPLWMSPHLNLIDADGLTDKYLANAPSVRDEAVAGPPVRRVAEIYEDFLMERGVSDPGRSERAVLKEEARQYQAELVVQRNTRYIMDRMRPEYVLVFDQELPGRFSKRGRIYPKVMAQVAAHPDFAKYTEDWSGPKVAGVTNRLYRREGTEKETDAETRLARMRAAIDANRGLGHLVPWYYEEVRRSRREMDGEAKELMVATAARFAADENLVRRIVMSAQRAGDNPLAEACLDAAFDMLPRDSALFRVKCEYLERIGNLNEAAEVMEAGALLADPWDNSFLYHLAYLYERRLADVDRALDATRRALRKDPADERAWSDYATIADRGGRTKEAMNGFERLLDLRGGNDAIIRERIASLKLRLEAEKAAELLPEAEEGE